MQGRRLDHARSNDSPAIKAPCPAEQHLPCASHARRPAHRGAGLSGGALRSPAVPVRQRGHGRPRTKVDPCFRPVGAGDRSVGETHPGATSPATVMQAWHRGSRRGGVSSRGVRPSVHGLMWAPGQDRGLRPGFDGWAPLAVERRTGVGGLRKLAPWARSRRPRP